MSSSFNYYYSIALIYSSENWRLRSFDIIMKKILFLSIDFQLLVLVEVYFNHPNPFNTRFNIVLAIAEAIYIFA